jgi:hypothetical protein
VADVLSSTASLTVVGSVTRRGIANLLSTASLVAVASVVSVIEPDIDRVLGSSQVYITRNWLVRPSAEQARRDAESAFV